MKLTPGYATSEDPFTITIWSLRLANKAIRDMVDFEARRMTWLGTGGSEEKPIPAVLPHLSDPNRWGKVVYIQCGGERGANLSHLKGMPLGLRELYVPGNRHIHSLAPLSGCKDLAFLNISSTSVQNLEYLAQAEKLMDLYFDECPVEDISFLKICGSMPENLHLSLTRVKVRE